jgi:hypothetical protein
MGGGLGGVRRGEGGEGFAGFRVWNADLYLRDASGEKKRRRPVTFTLGPLGMFVNTICLTIHGLTSVFSNLETRRLDVL